MGVIACVLVALAHTCFASGVLLEKSIALAVLRADLHELQTTFPSAQEWQESKIIKYDEKLKFTVSGFENRGNGKLYLQLNEKLTFAESHKGTILKNQRKFHKLFFRDDYFYFDNPTSQPVSDPEDTYIVGSKPSQRYETKPTIEYIPENTMTEYLKDVIPVVQHEKALTAAKVVKTYFRLKDGVKVIVWYDQETDVVLFKEDFHVVLKTNEKDVLKTRQHVDALSFFLNSPSSLRQMFSTMGAVYGVRVASSAQSPWPRVTDSLRLKRRQVIRDMIEGTPTYEMSLSNVIGTAVYDSSKVSTLRYIMTNNRIIRRMAGTFKTNDGILFYWLCLATPSNRKELDEGKFRGPYTFPDKAVLFPCVVKNTDVANVVLREEDDYIEIMNTAPIALDNVGQHSMIEPHVEYIPQEQFRHTIKIVSDLLNMRCGSDNSNRNTYRTYRLFVDVFVVYDCKTRVARFNKLDLWVGFNEHASLLSKTVLPLLYDSKTDEFRYDVGTISDFKVRQLTSVISKSFPIDVQYKIDCGNRFNLGIDLRSLEWDLYNLHKKMMTRGFSFGARYGLIMVDKVELVYAQMSEGFIGGEKKKFITVNGRGLFSSCVQDVCVEDREIIHDGTEMLMRDGSVATEVTANIFWPNTDCKYSHFSIDQVHYVKLSTFKSDMRELAWMLRRECPEPDKKGKRKEKLTFHVYYLNTKEPAIGYYHCTLQYLYFLSEFKVIKYPKIEKDSIEAPVIPKNILAFLQQQKSTDINLPESIQSQEKEDFSAERKRRIKYSDYIIRDLIYDHIGKKLHSESIFLNDIYAVRLLPPLHNSQRHAKGKPEELKLENGSKVLVYKHDVMK